jgi:hypothetical protein
MTDIFLSRNALQHISKIRIEFHQIQQRFFNNKTESSLISSAYFYDRPSPQTFALCNKQTKLLNSIK